MPSSCMPGINRGGAPEAGGAVAEMPREVSLPAHRQAVRVALMRVTCGGPCPASSRLLGR